jgi:hypothetical protein
MKTINMTLTTYPKMDFEMGVQFQGNYLENKNQGSLLTMTLPTHLLRIQELLKENQKESIL